MYCLQMQIEKFPLKKQMSLLWDLTKKERKRNINIANVSVQNKEIIQKLISFFSAKQNPWHFENSQFSFCLSAKHLTVMHRSKTDRKNYNLFNFNPGLREVDHTQISRDAT